MTITTLIKIHDLLKEDVRIREAEKNMVAERAKTRRGELNAVIKRRIEEKANYHEFETRLEEEEERFGKMKADTLNALMESRQALEDFEAHDWR